MNTLLLGGLLAYALISRFLFKSRLSQAPFSLTGIIASVGALPLFFRTFAELRNRRFGLFPFLSAAIGLAILTAEALTALEIIWVMSIGMYLEEFVTEKARRAIRDILRVAPTTAYIFLEGLEVEIPVSKLQKGDTVVAGFGQKIPIDGTVIHGEALVDESHINGRAHPELRKINDWVYAGTRIQQGFLHIRAEKVGEETYLCHITNLVEASLANRTEVEQKADVLAVRLTRLGVASTFLTYLLTQNVTYAFSVMLVMSCPCATVLAASTAIAAAIANAARHHILVKGGQHIEQINRIDCVCFDKTGTITTDEPEVVEVIPLTDGQDPAEILSMAAIAESQSDHPMAKAVMNAAKRNGVSVQGNPAAEVFVGKGVRAEYDVDTILVGNREFLESAGVDTDYFSKRSTLLMEAGHTILYVAKNGQLQGMITVSNTVRLESVEMISSLRNAGIQYFYLISGDTEPVVKNLSRELGFDDYRAPLLPEDKAQFVKSLKRDDRNVLMVGDGVNDALALSEATVGVAMGAGGSEVAVEASDIALANSDLASLIFLRHLSEHSLRTVETNFWIATSTNIGGILLGMGGWLPPIAAGILHIVHTLGIMFNSSRLIKWEPCGTQVKPEAFHGSVSALYESF
jgi:cation-transporting P-type ATPase C